MPGHVVVAPDKFKGSLGAAAVALAVADGLRAAVPGIDAREHPVADGGGGAGMIQALGGRLLDAAGAELALGGASLADLDRLDLSGFDPRVAVTEFVVASDVDNPLLGPYGAAAVYGPQKGASAAEVALLDAALARWAAAARAATGVDAAGVPGAGAAGGVGFAAVVFLGAELRSGIEYLLDLLEVRSALPGARLVVTGEGSLDEQTLRGKAPAGVAAAARAAGVPVVVVAGRNTLPPAALRAAGIAKAYALADLEADPDRSMREPVPLLDRLAGRIAADWLGGGP